MNPLHYLCATLACPEFSLVQTVRFELTLHRLSTCFLYLLGYACLLSRSACLFEVYLVGVLLDEIGQSCDEYILCFPFCHVSVDEHFLIGEDDLPDLHRFSFGLCWYSLSDSNRDCVVFKTIVSTNWTKGAWCGRRGSNSRPSRWQRDALPLSHYRMEPPKGIEPLLMHYESTVLPFDYGDLVPSKRVELLCLAALRLERSVYSIPPRRLVGWLV